MLESTDLARRLKHTMRIGINRSLSSLNQCSSIDQRCLHIAQGSLYLYSNLFSFARVLVLRFGPT